MPAGAAPVSVPGPFAIEAYAPELEPWYVFVRNEGLAGFDAPRSPHVAQYPSPRPLRTFLIREGAVYVGFIDLDRLARDPHALEILAIGVLPHYRRRGLGGLLVGAAGRFAHEGGYARLEALVRVLDPRTHVFFRRHGFDIAELGVEVERESGERATLPPAEVPLESRGVAIRHLVYLYRRQVP